jgi:hypothetical protein
VVATTAAMPKNAPCGRPATNRATISSVAFGATADRPLPSASAIVRTISRPLRGSFAASPAMSGAPTTTPSA